MTEYIIKVDESDERWHYVEQQYTHFFGYPITDEVVRCGDCEWGIDGGKYCAEGASDSWDWRNVDPDGFCAWGERKGDAE